MKNNLYIFITKDNDNHLIYAKSIKSARIMLRKELNVTRLPVMRDIYWME